MDEGVEVLQGRLPAVMTVVKEASTPRFASLSGWMSAKHAAISKWSAKDVGAEPQLCGLNGSPTKVVRIFAPPVKTGGQRVDATTDAAAAVSAIINILQAKGLKA
jgi:electron transfer flavoprotein beta subunit